MLLSLSYGQVFFFLLFFPLLIATRQHLLSSTLFHQLSIPLTYANSKEISPSSWSRYNPIYGALLWRGKAIDSLAFTLNKAQSIASNSSAKHFLNEMFHLNGAMDTVINWKFPIKNLGCLAGCIFVFHCEKGKNYSELSGRIQSSCRFHFSSEYLAGLLDHETFRKENGFWIKDFAACLISSFVWAFALNSSNSQKILSVYRREFNEIVESSQCERNLSSFHEYSSIFEQLLELLKEDFAANAIPNQLQYKSDFSARGVCWANCVETVLCNWLLVGAFNLEENNFNFNSLVVESKLNMQLLVHEANGFDVNVELKGICEMFQNLPFVIYQKLRFPNGNILRIDESFTNANGFVCVPRAFLAQNKHLCYTIENVKFYQISFSSSPKSVFLALELETCENLWLYEVDSLVVNFLTIGFHLGIKSVLNAFESVEMIFQDCFSNEKTIEHAINDNYALGNSRLLRIPEGTKLVFPFGNILIFNCHSSFEAARNQSIDLYPYDLLSEDMFLRQIYGMEDFFYSPLERTLSSFISHKNVNWHQSAGQLRIPVLDFFQKAYSFEIDSPLCRFIRDDLNFWLECHRKKKIHIFESLIIYLLQDFIRNISEGIFHLIWDSLEHLTEKQTFLFPLMNYIVKDSSLFQDEIFHRLLEAYSEGNKIIELYQSLGFQMCYGALAFISQDLIFFLEDESLEKRANLLLQMTIHNYRDFETVKTIWQNIQNQRELAEKFTFYFENFCLQTCKDYIPLFIAYTLENSENIAVEELKRLMKCISPMKTNENFPLKNNEISHMKSEFAVYFSPALKEKFNAIEKEFGPNEALSELKSICCDSSKLQE